MPFDLYQMWKFTRLTGLFLRFRLGKPREVRLVESSALDPQLQLLVEAMRVLDPTGVSDETPESARLQVVVGNEALRRLGNPPDPVAETRDLSIPSPTGNIPARYYRPDNKGPLPLMVFFHGGGWVVGGIATHDIFCRALCHRSGCAVLSVDYRLAPEHPFPAAQQDCYAAVQWAALHMDELQGDPARLLVGGDSAGGNLAAVTALHARNNNGPKIAGQMLIYPVVNATDLNTKSYKEFGEQSLGLSRPDMRWYIDRYLPNPADRSNPLASPLLEKNLRDLPPALIITSEFDVLRDEGEAYANRLRKAGVKVDTMRCTGMIHGFMSLGHVVRQADEYVNEVVQRLHRLAG